MIVSIQQAANNALAAYLASNLSGIQVLARWPQPDFQGASQQVTVVLAGKRRDTPIDLTLLSKSNVGSYQTQAVWQVAACEQPLQLDVWSNSDVARDDIIARLDNCLNTGQSGLGYSVAGPAVPAGAGVLLAVADGWQDFSTTADFEFDIPDIDDSSDSEGRRVYRASYSGSAYFMLAVTTLTARQVAINFNLRLAQADNTYTDFP